MARRKFECCALVIDKNNRYVIAEIRNSETEIS